MLKNLKTFTVCPNRNITGKEFSDDCERRKTEFQRKYKQERISIYNLKPKIRIIAAYV